MTNAQRKAKLSILVQDYKTFKSQGKLDLTSEETIRTWLNEMLSIFGWDVRDTSQILQEKVLSKEEKEKLKQIGSQNTRPDYTLKVANEKITFLDAKDINVSIKNDKSATFQIKSYGWSIMAPCAYISNFEEFAIYDCTYIPDQDQSPELGRTYLTIDDYEAQFDVLENHLLRDNVQRGSLKALYQTTQTSAIPNKDKVTLDQKFAEILSNFRLKLAQNIYQNNKATVGDNTELLGYLTQVIINRVLFIRVCEAKKIEKEGLLQEFKNTGFWGAFKNSSYFDFYDHYDGPLFEREEKIHNLKIDDSIFNDMLLFLYYPSPYRFDVIPTKLLSDIYEIFLSKRLVIEKGVVKDELKLEYTKTNGAVSTPQYLVREIIKRTLNRKDIKALGIGGLLSLKVLDIACGSGVFIIEAFEYLEAMLTEMYEETKDTLYTQYFIQNNDKSIINVLGKKAIIDNCLFGIDIDAEAVEVAKMSLSLKMIDTVDDNSIYHELGIYVNKILNKIGENIKCGNSLVSSDIITLYPEITNSKNELEYLRTNPFDWKEGFEQVFLQRGGFDYIIGNPPYVEVKNYNVQMPHMHAYIKNVYLSSSNHKIDLAIPFIEKALEVLNGKGRLGFIVQKRFFGTDYGKKIREMISKGGHVSSIVDFSATDIFKGRITYVAILLLNKQKQDQYYYRNFTDDTITLSNTLREADIPEINDKQYTKLDKSSLSANPWNFGDEELLKIRTRLQSLRTLSDYVKVKVGIQVLWDKAYHIRKESIANSKLKGKNHVDRNINIELDACRPLMCNEKFYPFTTEETEVYVIFPYDVHGSTVIPIKFTDFCTRYPLAGAYLKKHKQEIITEVETYADLEEWHLYTRVQNHNATYPKILVPMTAQDPIATVITSEKAYCDNANMYFIEAPIKDDKTLYALSTVINSTIFSVLARSIANPQQGGYYKFNKQFLSHVPFPLKFGVDITLTEQLHKIGKELEAMQVRYKRASPVQRKSLKALLNSKWIEADKLVADLYELTQDERYFFSAKTRNINRIDLIK